MTRRKTHEEFVKEVQEKHNNEYNILGCYKNNCTKIKVRHNSKECNYHEWYITPSNLLGGQGCPKCGKEKIRIKLKKTHEEFIEQLNKVHGEGTYTPLEKYKGANIKILVKHNKCGYEWNTTPNRLLLGNGCPVCGRETVKEGLTKTHQQFSLEIKSKYGEEYEILSEYKGTHKKILVRHNCGYVWEAMPSNLLNGNRCPICSRQKAVLGVNTIWDTDRWMVDLGVSEEDAKRYSRCSNKRITVVCPDCDREKKIQINNIYNNKSISCSCGDGKSYPEKFIMSVLEQLGLYFEIEYSPSWFIKRYDFYLKYTSCIIETHGMQHYEEGFYTCGGRTLEQEQANDNLKRNMALSNGIKHYIELDCRESNLEYIKNSILNSELANLFNLSNIDWNRCAEFANKNIVKEVCNYWNNKKEDETTVDLGRIFKLSTTTIRKYLKKGTKLGWCNYTANFGKKVEVFKDNKSLGIFSSCAELERQSEKLFGVKLFKSNIGHVCLGRRKQHKGFTFKYVEENK
ncbi:hypothetical protein H8J86_08555 [Clostridium perfringens]|uniref:hypothetical protein n=1 Tax=Clostridium perfringens TaxID=1502 RepID=UPI0018E4D713|nr:hypothetical protein [Clostridium perfringens]MBI6006005.1 hypothetical protein [Clostridium perfringens]